VPFDKLKAHDDKVRAHDAASPMGREVWTPQLDFEAN
jgi:hypothetical protein